MVGIRTYPYSELKFKEFNEDTLTLNAVQGLNFRGTEIKYDAFAQAFNAQPDYAEYRDASKWLALPLALLELVKVIVNLASALFPGLLYATFSTIDRGSYSLSQLYHAARLAQSAFGRFVFIFNPTYGQYHIQESLFYRECYSLYNPVCGLDFAKLSPAQALRVFPEIIYFKSDTKKLNDIQFKFLIPKLPDKYYFYVPTSRLNLIDFNTVTTSQLRQLFYGSKSTEKRLGALLEDNFVNIVDKLDKDQLEYIPKKYIKFVNFENIENEKLKKIFCVPFSSQQNTQKLAALNPDNFKIVFEKLKDDSSSICNFLDDVPENHLNDIDYNQLDDSIINKLFYVGYFSDSRREKTITRLENLNDANFKIVCKKCKDELFALIPLQLLNQIDYETLNVEQYLNVLQIFEKLSVEKIRQYLSKERRNALYQTILKYNPYQANSWEFLVKLPQETIKALCAELGIDSNNPTHGEITTSYKKLIRKYHPDKIIKKDNESDDEYQRRCKAAEAKVSAISEAYNTLINQ